MKRIWIAVLIAGLAVLTGCKTATSPAEIPSNQMTPVVWNENTRDVLMNATDKDIQVLASALESQTESGSVIYVDHQGWVYNPDGTLFLDKKGNPIKVRTRVIAKLNSLKELAGMESVQSFKYRVGGFDYVKDLPETIKNKDLCPEALHIEVEGIGVLNAVDTTAQNREAAAKEREAIFAGLAQVASARGAAVAIKVQAMADGAVKIITAIGQEIVGRIVGTTVLETSVSGASRVLEVALQKSDGTQTKVITEGKDSDVINSVVK